MAPPSMLTCSQRSLTSIPTPTNTLITVNGTPACNGIDINWMGEVHGKGDNYTFADGHAKYFARTAVTYKMYGISSDVYAWQNNGSASRSQYDRHDGHITRECGELLADVGYLRPHCRPVNHPHKRAGSKQFEPAT